ncbi:PP0621 family protein, partial [Achromobacter xylosoxidans]|uniref:PP0621 family protein n=1 Tax=Alcaligenes xylosoxydans xylosoxydans TaxID=85698 RepID=UPI002402BFCC
AKPRGTATPPAAGAPEAMVRCAHCGIHLPRSEALLQGGRTWCSQEHARLGPAAK